MFYPLKINHILHCQNTLLLLINIIESWESDFFFFSPGKQAESLSDLPFLREEVTDRIPGFELCTGLYKDP